MTVEAAGGTERGDVSPAITIRPITLTDLDEITRVHRAAFPRSPLSLLGPGAIWRYYHWQLTGPHDGHPIGAWIGDELAGFCFGGIWRGAFGGFLRRNRGYFAGRVLARPWLIANPLFRDRLMKGIRSVRPWAPKKPVPTRAPQSSGEPFSILSIAVDPEWQGYGIGKQLMAESERIAREQGFREMSLTVHSDNAQAIGFYQRLGWVRYERDGQWEGEMRKSLNESTAA